MIDQNLISAGAPLVGGGLLGFATGFAIRKIMKLVYFERERFPTLSHVSQSALSTCSFGSDGIFIKVSAYLNLVY